MDGWLILLRIVHVGLAMCWFGGAIIGGFFLAPTATVLGKAGQPFMDHLIHRRRMGIGLQTAWISSPTGLAFTIGGIAALAAFVGGAVLVGPSVAEQTAVQNEPARGDCIPTETQRQRLQRADRRMRLAYRIDMPLLLLAGLTMAVARYL